MTGSLDDFLRRVVDDVVNAREYPLDEIEVAVECSCGDDDCPVVIRSDGLYRLLSEDPPDAG